MIYLKAKTNKVGKEQEAFLTTCFLFQKHFRFVLDFGQVFHF